MQVRLSPLSEKLIEAYGKAYFPNANLSVAQLVNIVLEQSLGQLELIDIKNQAKKSK